MAIKRLKGITSGVGTPQIFEGQNGDMTVRSSNEGKILYVKDRNKWHGMHLGINIRQIMSDVDTLLKKVREISNKTRNKPILDAAFFRKPGSANVQLKNDGGILKVRNAADTDDVVLSAKTVQLKITEAFDFATLTEGSLIYDASTELFIAQAGGMYLLNNLEAGAHSVQLRMATSDADAATIYMEGASTVWSVGFDYSDKLNFKIQPDFVFNTTDYGFTLSSAYSPGDCGGQATFTTINRNTGDITVKSLHLDLDQTAITGTGDTANNIGLDLDINSNAVTQVGTVNNTGIDMDLTAATDGVQTNVGMDITCAGADINRGINITVPDALTDYHIRMFAADDTGDYATLKVADTGDLTISTKDDSATAGDIILDADGAVEINADAGGITFKDAAADLFYIAAGRFDSYYDASNHVRYTVADDGAHAITVTGSVAGSASYTVTSGGLINLDAGRSLTLDAGDGAFLAKNAGTEFSVANSAYAGMMIGCTHVFGSGVNGVFQTVTTAWESLLWDTDKYALVTFVVPPSNKVKISVFLPYVQLSGYILQLGLATDSSATTLNTKYENNSWDVDETDTININYSWVVEGSDHSWSAGETKTLYIMAYADGGIRLYTGGTNTDKYGGVIVEATALPAAIGDGSEP